MKKQLLILMVMIFVGFMTQSCSKEDPGFNGDKTIVGKVTYPDGAAAGAHVSIKFNAESATTDYDYITVADKDGNYKFQRLAPGNYYVTADYTCNQGLHFQSGGSKVKVGTTGGEVRADLTLQ